MIGKWILRRRPHKVTIPADIFWKVMVGAAKAAAACRAAEIVYGTMMAVRAQRLKEEPK